MGQPLLCLREGVIHHVIPAPAAVGRQVGLDAVAHRRGHHLGRQVADHMGPVGIGVAAGIKDQSFALGLVVTPELHPQGAAPKVLIDVPSPMPRSHRRQQIR